MFPYNELGIALTLIEVILPSTSAVYVLVAESNEGVNVPLSIIKDFKLLSDDFVLVKSIV